MKLPRCIFPLLAVLALAAFMPAPSWDVCGFCDFDGDEYGEGEQCYEEANPASIPAWVNEECWFQANWCLAYINEEEEDACMQGNACGVGTYPCENPEASMSVLPEYYSVDRPADAVREQH